MAWVKIDDQAPRNRKLRRAGAAAAWLWVCGLAHCQSQLTDGFIHEDDIAALGFTGDSLRRCVARLVDVQLWEAVDGGFRVHDYLEFNADRATVLEKRKAEQERKRKERRNGGRAKARVRQDGTRTAVGQPVDVQPPSSAPIPSHPTLPKEQEEKSAPTLTTKPKKDNGHPRSHVFCGERFCVPQFMHDQFDRQLGNRGGEFDLLGWYVDLDRGGGAPIPETLEFLRDEFKLAVQRQFGVTKKQPAVGAAAVAAKWSGFLDECDHEPRCGSSWRCDQLRQMAAMKGEDAVQGPGEATGVPA